MAAAPDALRELARPSGRSFVPSPALRHAIRYGTAAAAALWLAYAAGFPQPTWPLITVLMIAQPTPGGSIQKGLLRMSGSVLAGLVSIFIYGGLAQDPLMFAISICLVYGIGIYFMNGPRFGYAWNVFAFTSGIILGDAMAGTSSVEILAFDRVSLVLIGLIVGLLAEAVFWPASTEVALATQSAERLGEVAARLGAQRDRLQGRSADDDDAHEAAPGAPTSPLLDGLSQLDQLPYQLGIDRARTRAWSQVVVGAESLVAAGRALDADIAGLRPAVASSLGAAIADVLDRVRDVVGACARRVVDASAPRADLGLVHAAWSRFAELRSGLADGDAAIALAPSSAIASTVDRTIGVVVALDAAIAGIAGETDDGTGRVRPSSARRPPLRLRVEIDRLRMEMALRGALAVGSVLIVMPLMGWEPSSTPMTLAFMVASLPTRTATGQTAIGLVVAALVAWLLSDLAIVYIVPHMGRMPEALLLPAGIAGVAGWLVVARPKIGAIAPIVALVGILSVFGGAQPPSNVAGPYVTTWIFFIGIVIGLVAQRLLWPRTAAEQLCMRTSDRLDLCRSLIAGAARPEVDSLDLGRAVMRDARLAQACLQLHAHAAAEPVDARFDDATRASLVRGTSDVFDAVLRVRGTSTERTPLDRSDTREAWAPLRTAVEALDQSVLEALASISVGLRTRSVGPAVTLARALEALEPAAIRVRRAPGWAEGLDAAGLDATATCVGARRRLAESVASLALDARTATMPDPREHDA